MLAARPSLPLKKVDDLPDSILDLAATSLQQGFRDGMARLLDIRTYLLALQRCVTPVLEDFYAAAEAHELCALVAGGCLQLSARTYMRAAGRGAGCKSLLRVLTAHLRYAAYSLSVHASRGRRETVALRFPRRSTRRQTAKLCGTTEQRGAGVVGVV